jgi:uncharacterized protein YuzE
MRANVHHDKVTDVAYVDVCTDVPADVRIDVQDVTDQLGMNTQVLARVDENGRLLGIVIQDYTAFKRELRRKYLALAVEKIIDLIVTKVLVLTTPSSGYPAPRRLTAHA